MDMTEASPVLALVGGTLIDGTGAAPTRPCVILLSGAQILAVGTAQEISVPDNAVVIDVAGMTVMPGLIDLHAHLSLAPSKDPWSAASMDPFTPTQTDLVLWGAAHASKVLEAGFTTVRDAFSFHDNTMSLSLRMATASGLLVGPRIFTAGYVGSTASEVDMRLSGQIPRPYGRTADGPWEMRKRAREVLRDGHDWIKSFTSGGRVAGAEEEDVWYVNHTTDEMDALADEVHRYGARLMVHATTSDAIMLAVKAGADTIEHGWPLTDEIIEEMVKRGTVLVPTISVYSERGLLREQVQTALRNRATRQVEKRLASFRKAVEAGVKIATGTDIMASAPTMTHGENAFEITMMVRNGMPPLAAITSSTRTAAEVLGISGWLGTLREGMTADVLVVEGDPLTDITRIETGVRYVIRDGKVVVDKAPARTPAKA